ncbi:MAG: hypothetical protein JAZ17_04815 [Candidatus Thiodiazotropha endolucinida]|nr:hypothetical protein [Candidatus Thiodiazotropha endolucinida]
MTNPSKIFYERIKPNVDRTRAFVVADVTNMSAFLLDGAQSLVNKRLKKNNVPVLGELIPWMLSDLFELEPVQVQDIATAWLKVYLYTCLIDDLLDEEARFSPEEILTSSLLFQEGSAALFNVVRDTKYETLLKKSFYLSAEGELQDLSQQQDIAANKSSTSIKKNYVLLSCAAALAARADKRGNAIVEFSEAILLGLQYLDDIADWEQDFENGNYTKLLSQGIDFETELTTTPSRKRMLSSLVETGALSDLLFETSSILEKAILIALPHRLDNSSAGGIYLVSLYDSVMAAVDVVKEARRNLRLPGCETNCLLDQVESALQKIAQSS